MKNGSSLCECADGRSESVDDGGWEERRFSGGGAASVRGFGVRRRRPVVVGEGLTRLVFGA